MVIERKGAYCFAQNCLLLDMLRGLGYRCVHCAQLTRHCFITDGLYLCSAYCVGARPHSAIMSPGEEPYYRDMVHSLILVQPIIDGNETYLVDAGYGKYSPVRPILLCDGAETWGAAPPERHRLIRAPHPDSSLGKFLRLGGGVLIHTLIRFPESYDNKRDSPHHLNRLEIWLDHGHPRGSGWSILYCFDESEFFMADILAANIAASTRTGFGTWCWKVVSCVKHFALTDEDMQSIGAGGESITTATVDEKVDQSLWLGRIILFSDRVTRVVGGQIQVLCTLGTELERIRALRDIFGVTLDEGDVHHIEGRKSSLALLRD
jgi:arylamine N-acetyltransferase